MCPTLRGAFIAAEVPADFGGLLRLVVVAGGPAGRAVFGLFLVRDVSRFVVIASGQAASVRPDDLAFQNPVATNLAR